MESNNQSVSNVGHPQLRQPHEGQHPSLTEPTRDTHSEYHPHKQFLYNSEWDNLHHPQAVSQTQRMLSQLDTTSPSPRMLVLRECKQSSSQFYPKNSRTLPFATAQDNSMLLARRDVNDRSSIFVHDPDPDLNRTVHQNFLFPKEPFKLYDLSDTSGHNTQPTESPKSIGKKVRSYSWPSLSDPPEIIPKPVTFETETVGKGNFRYGRNMLAKIDGVVQTRYNIRVPDGRKADYLAKSYPTTEKAIPGGMTLTEICQQYPRHVWGTGLRMFIAEGWDGERIYNALPDDFKAGKNAQRNCNYIQQGMGRERSKMKKEAGMPPKTGQNRLKRKRGAEASVDNDKSADETKSVDEFDIDVDMMSDAETSEEEMDESVHSDLCKAEMAKQHRLFLHIMQLRCPQFATESPEWQDCRIASARARLGEVYCLDLEDGPLNDLVRFTKVLREDSEDARREHALNPQVGLWHSEG